jgi:hypothetical protein
VARAWPSQAIRLDAYDATAGAGRFYLKCGFREVGRVTYRKVPLIYFELLLLLSTSSRSYRLRSLRSPGASPSGGGYAWAVLLRSRCCAF